MVGGLQHVVKGDCIPAITAHKLDSGFKEQASFKFDEHLEGGIVLLGDQSVCSLRLDEVVDEIGIGK